MKLYFIFCLCYPIFMNNGFNDMICMLNTNSRFTLYYVNVEERILLDKKYVSAIVDGVITIIGTRYTKNGLWYVDLAPNGNPLPAAHPYYVNMANSVYAQKANTELLDFLHQPAFRPTVSSRTKATNNNFFTTWPGLPSDAVQKSLQESINTARGHTKTPPKNIRSTKPYSSIQHESTFMMTPTSPPWSLLSEPISCI